MNTAIYTDQRSANIGIGFATPINAIRAILPQLRIGKVMRGVIGVEVRTDPLTKEDAQAFGLPNTNGARADDGRPKARPAEKAGLQPGDVIVEFNGKPVNDSDALVVDGRRHQAGHHRAADGLPRQPAQVAEHHDRRARPRRRAGHDRREPNDDSEPTSTGFGMTIEPITPDDRARARAAARQGRRDRQQRRAAAARPPTPAWRRRRHPRGEPPAGDATSARSRASCESAAPGSTGVPARLARRPAGGQETFLTLRKR